MTQSQVWGDGLHERIAAAVRKARQGRMSAQELADETERLGYPISRSQIANYESGRKQSLDVAELLVLAAALDIPPGLLLFPGYPTGDTEILPGHTTTTLGALNWFSGAGTLPAPEGSERRPALPNEGTELVRLVRQYQENVTLLLYLQRPSILKPDAKDSDAQRRLADQQIATLKERLAELQEQIDELEPTFEITEKPR